MSISSVQSGMCNNGASVQYKAGKTEVKETKLGNNGGASYPVEDAPKYEPMEYSYNGGGYIVPHTAKAAENAKAKAAAEAAKQADEQQFGYDGETIYPIGKDPKAGHPHTCECGANYVFVACDDKTLEKLAEMQAAIKYDLDRTY